MKYRKRKKRTKASKKDNVNVTVYVTEPRPKKEPMTRERKWTITLWIVDFMAITSIVRVFTDDVDNKDVGAAVLFAITALIVNIVHAVSRLRARKPTESVEWMVTVDHHRVSIGSVVYFQDPTRDVCGWQIRAIAGEVTGFSRDDGELWAEVSSVENERQVVRWFRDFELFANALNIGKEGRLRLARIHR